MNNQFNKSTPTQFFTEIGNVLFAAADDSMFVIDDMGAFVEVNAAACELTGYVREALLDLSLSSLFFDNAGPERPLSIPLPVSDTNPWPAVLHDKNGRSLPVGIETRHLAESHLLLIVQLSQPQIEKNLFQSLNENPAVGFWILDEAGRFLAVNEGYLRQSGYSRQELLARHIGEVTVPEKPEETATDWQTVIMQGYGLFETQHRKKNGEIWPVEISVTHANGRFFNFAQDITERKHLEDELRRKSHALEKSLNGFDIVSSEGQFLYANQAYLTMWGYDSLDEILGTSPTGHCADPAIPGEIIRNLEAKGEYTLEFTALRKDGSTFQVLMAAQKMVDDQGVVTYAGTSIDITEREQARLALLAEHTRLRQVLDTIPDMVWLKDPAGAYLGCNPPFERLMGVKEAELLGKTDYEFFDKETAEFFRRHDRNAALAGKPTSNEEWLTSADSGQRLLVETIKNPLLDEAGQLVGVLGIARDITGRRETEEALRQSETQYRLLFDTMQRGVVYQAADGLILSMNPAAERILGKTKAEFLGETSESVEHDTLTEDGQPFPGLEHPSMIALRTGEIVRDVPMQVYNPREQQYRLISITAVPLFRDGQTEPYQVYTIFDDITQRHKAEKALHDSEERFRVAVKNSNFIPAQYDKELRYQWIYNPHPDFDPSQIIGKRDDELEDSAGGRELMALKRQVVESGIGLRQEVSFLRSDGLHVYDFTIEPLYDENGTLIGGATAAFDITGRKRAEQALYLMSDTQKQIAILDDLAAIYRLVGQNVLKLIGDGYTVTSMLDEEAQGMRIVGMYGFGRVYQNLTQRFKIDPTKMIYPVADMTDEELRIYRSGRLEKVEEGVYALLTRKVPRRICEIVENQLKVRGTYTMGFVWHGRHYGGISILTKQDITPYKEMIEAIMNQASIAINRIKSERALRESEGKLRLFIEHAPASLAMFDHQMRYLAVSHRWLADYSLGDQDIIGQSHYDIFPEIPDRWKAIHQRGLAGEVIRADEDAFVRADGHVQWLRWEVRPWYTDGGNIGGIVVFTEDITERKRASEALHEVQDILATAESIARVGSWKLDLGTRKVTWSDEMFNIFGVSPMGFDGDVFKLIDECVHPDDLALVKQGILAAIESLQLTSYEYRIVLPDGAERIVWTEGKVAYDSSGVPTALVGYVQDITERKQAEKALRESEERYHNTLENMLEGCQIIGFDWRYLYLNASAARHGRSPKEQLVGRTMMEVYPGIEDTKLFTALRRCMAERKPQRLENKFYYEDGSFAWFDLSIQPVPEGLFILSIDITEKKQAEDALRRSEERFSKAFNLSPAALSLTRSNGRIIDVNESYERLTGYNREELVNHDATDLQIFTLQQRADLRQQMTEQGGLLHEAELTVRTKSGELRHVMYSVEMIEIEGEECALTLALDITERKQADATIAQLNRRMELILNSVGEGIYGMDMNGRITFINSAFAQMLGWEQAELFGQNAHDVFHHTRSDGRFYPATECRIQQAIAGGREYHAAEDLFWRKDGTSFAVDYTCTPIREEGQMVGTVVVAKDITERKRAAEEQALLEEQLRQSQKMESIGRLAGGVAHDFNNQLTIIRLYGDLIRATITKEDPLVPKLEQIRQATDRATGLTGQLLAFSRKQILQPVVLNLNELVTNLQKMLTRLIGEDIILSTVLEPGLWSIMADRGQIEQVLMNLIINARDAMPTGGMLTIETTNLYVDEQITHTHLDMPLGRCVLLAITDSGHGMDEATKKQIFEPFFTTKEVGKGTGLGLATVHGIIKQSGGAIFVYSEPEQGSTFKIYLPANSADGDDLTSDQSVTAMLPGNETILLVEDEAIVRDLIKVTLQEFGYIVLEAEDSQHALVLAEQHPGIDLLLTDVVMPQMSGQEVARSITDSRPEMKVLFISGYMDDAIMRHGLLAAEVNFLAKPFTRSDLASKVREVLDKR